MDKTFCQWNRKLLLAIERNKKLANINKQSKNNYRLYREFEAIPDEFARKSSFANRLQQA